MVSAATNIPLDRVVKKVTNLKESLDSQHAAWKRVAMALGWSTWDVSVDPYEEEKSKLNRKNIFPKRKKSIGGKKRKNVFPKRKK